MALKLHTDRADLPVRQGHAPARPNPKPRKIQVHANGTPIAATVNLTCRIRSP